MSGSKQSLHGRAPTDAPRVLTWLWSAGISSGTPRRGACPRRVLGRGLVALGGPFLCDAYYK